jgi:hypothetical protein
MSREFVYQTKCFPYIASRPTPTQKKKIFYFYGKFYINFLLFLKKILAFLNTKTNIDYEIHIIGEVGHHGLILSLLSNSDKHFRSGAGLYLPAKRFSNIADRFSHSIQNSMFDTRP